MDHSYKFIPLFGFSAIINSWNDSGLYPPSMTSLYRQFCLSAQSSCIDMIQYGTCEHFAQQQQISIERVQYQLQWVFDGAWGQIRNEAQQKSIISSEKIGNEIYQFYYRAFLRQKAIVNKMSSPLINNSGEIPNKMESKFKSSDICLNAQFLRIQAAACSKQIHNIWFLDQSQICTFFQKYNNLPLSRISTLELFETEGARIIKNENKIFLGQVYNKKKHGKGIAVYRDGRIYEGQFYENQKQGYASELYGNGNLYVGQFSQNKKHGKGSLYWFSLCTPACTKDASAKIEQYHGDWWGGLPDGQGEHQKANGDFYVGCFKNGLKHGNGVEYYANGDIYKGEFVNGLAEGYGQYLWTDGSTFKGDFKQGYRNGYGVWVSKGGKETYKGHYLLDRKHGYGIYDWGNNTIYKGQYLEDLRAGQGELFSNGQLVYSGLWENGERAEDFNANMTPPKKQAHKSTDQNQKQASKSLNANHSLNFRVKQSKVQFKSTGRRLSANTVKKDSFQVNFKFMDSRVSTHRGCQACCKRPSTGSFSQKFRRKNNFLNPEECAH